MLIWKLQWRYAGNIWNNAAISTFLYVLATPFRWIGRLFQREIFADRRGEAFRL